MHKKQQKKQGEQAHRTSPHGISPFGGRLCSLRPLGRIRFDMRRQRNKNHSHCIERSFGGHRRFRAKRRACGRSISRQSRRLGETMPGSPSTVPIARSRKGAVFPAMPHPALYACGCARQIARARSPGDPASRVQVCTIAVSVPKPTAIQCCVCRRAIPKRRLPNTSNVQRIKKPCLSRAGVPA